MKEKELTWAGAATACQSLGAGSHLVEVTTASQQAALVEELIRTDGYTRYFWTAATDVNRYDIRNSFCQELWETTH